MNYIHEILFETCQVYILTVLRSLKHRLAAGNINYIYVFLFILFVWNKCLDFWVSVVHKNWTDKFVKSLKRVLKIKIKVSFRVYKA